VREDCNRCRRPAEMCVCDAIEVIHNKTAITVIQHPGERAHPFNTARLTRLTLARSEVRVAWKGAMEPLQLPADTALLFPGEAAVDLEDLAPGSRPSHLVVLDGTWPQARSLYRQNPWLRQLRHVQLSPKTPSSYRIRREPALHCLSTIESIDAALRVCEPDTPGLGRLLAGFDALVEGQLAHRSRNGAQPRRLERKPCKPTQVSLLQSRWQDVVVVYAETTPARGGVPDEQLELAQWVAFRPATGVIFDHIARVEQVPNSCQLEHMELTQQQLARAPSFEQLSLAWRQFRRPTDLFVAWSRAGALTALRALADDARVMHLKSMYCNLRRGPSGTPDQVLAREQIDPWEVEARGRAGARIGNASALVEWLAAQG